MNSRRIFQLCVFVGLISAVYPAQTFSRGYLQGLGTREDRCIKLGADIHCYCDRTSRYIHDLSKTCFAEDECEKAQGKLVPYETGDSSVPPELGRSSRSRACLCDFDGIAVFITNPGSDQCSEEFKNNLFSKRIGLELTFTSPLLK